MKKFYIPYIVFCVLVIALVAINISAISEQNDYKPEEKVNEIKKEVNTTNPVKKVTETKREYYTVRLMDNNIYLFDKDNNILDKLDIDYYNLREYDKKQFEAGIQLADKSEVFSLIEDFSN